MSRPGDSVGLRTSLPLSNPFFGTKRASKKANQSSTQATVARQLPRFAFLANAAPAPKGSKAARPTRSIDSAAALDKNQGVQSQARKSQYPPFVQGEAPESLRKTTLLRMYGENGPFPDGGKAKATAYPPFVEAKPTPEPARTKRASKKASAPKAAEVKAEVAPRASSVRASAFPPFVGAEPRETKLAKDESAEPLERLRSRSPKKTKPEATPRSESLPRSEKTAAEPKRRSEIQEQAVSGEAQAPTGRKGRQARAKALVEQRADSPRREKRGEVDAGAVEGAPRRKRQPRTEGAEGLGIRSAPKRESSARSMDAPESTPQERGSREKRSPRAERPAPPQPNRSARTVGVATTPPVKTETKTPKAPVGVANLPSVKTLVSPKTLAQPEAPILLTNAHPAKVEGQARPPVAPASPPAASQAKPQVQQSPPVGVTNLPSVKTLVSPKAPAQPETPILLSTAPPVKGEGQTRPPVAPSSPPALGQASPPVKAPLNPPLGVTNLPPAKTPVSPKAPVQPELPILLSTAPTPPAVGVSNAPPKAPVAPKAPAQPETPILLSTAPPAKGEGPARPPVAPASPPALGQANPPVKAPLSPPLGVTNLPPAKTPVSPKAPLQPELPILLSTAPTPPAVGVSNAPPKAPVAPKAPAQPETPILLSTAPNPLAKPEGQTKAPFAPVSPPLMSQASPLNPPSVGLSNLPPAKAPVSPKPPVQPEPPALFSAVPTLPAKPEVQTKTPAIELSSLPPTKAPAKLEIPTLVSTAIPPVKAEGQAKAAKAPPLVKPLGNEGAAITFGAQSPASPLGQGDLPPAVRVVPGPPAGLEGKAAAASAPVIPVRSPEPPPEMVVRNVAQAAAATPLAKQAAAPTETSEKKEPTRRTSTKSEANAGASSFAAASVPGDVIPVEPIRGRSHESNSAGEQTQGKEDTRAGSRSASSDATQSVPTQTSSSAASAPEKGKSSSSVASTAKDATEPKPEVKESKPEAKESKPEVKEPKVEAKEAKTEPEPPRAAPVEANRSVSNRLQAERDLLKGGSGDSMLLSRSAKPTSPAREQTLFQADKRSTVESGETLFGRADSPRRRSTDLDRNRILWLKDKGLVSKPTAPNTFRSQVLSAEEKVVHRALSDLVPQSLQLSGVHIATNSSQVRAQISADGGKLDEPTIARLRRDFLRLTGRQLVIDTAAPKAEDPSVRAAGRGTPSKPALSSTPVSGGGAAKPTASSEPTEAVERPRKLIPAERPASSTTTPGDAPAKPSIKTISYAVAGLESAAATAAAAAHHATVLALNPEVVIDPKIGIVDGPKQIEGRYAPPPSVGGSSRTQRYQPPTKPETDEEDGEASQRAKKGEAGAETAKERLVHAERTEIDDLGDRERERGRRGGSSACRSCGTELPEAQQQACPVCAQSGEDVIALTSVNYRFAGSKFLAAADAVSASAGARELLEQGAVGTVASLRYKQKIPGHKDFLRFRAT